MPDIRHEVLIGASPESIYQALTSQEGLSAWWTPGASAKPELNSIARFDFGPAYFKKMKITGLDPARRVDWTCIAGAAEWIGTTISFELQPGDREALLQAHPELGDQVQQQNGNRGTLLIFHHNGWRDYTPMFAECNYTWAQMLRSLKLWCETGRGRSWPHQHSIQG